jgi:hypothetical protein
VLRRVQGAMSYKFRTGMDVNIMPSLEDYEKRAVLRMETTI